MKLIVWIFYRQSTCILTVTRLHCKNPNNWDIQNIDVIIVKFVQCSSCHTVVHPKVANRMANTIWAALRKHQYNDMFQCLRSFSRQNWAKDRWVTTWQHQQNECAPSEDSDQPGHPPSLIRVFAVRSMGSSAFFMQTAKTLIRLGGCPGWSESSLGTQFILLVLSWGGSLGSL